MSHTVPFCIRMFGPLQVELDGQPLPRLRSRKGHWILALLVLRHGREVERAWLAGTLWPDSPAAQALANLRNSLLDLRRALGPEARRLRAPSPQTLALDLSGAEVDLLPFDAAVARDDLLSLQQAVSVYHGPLLEGCAEEWVFQERQTREEAYLRALETLADRARADGDAETAAGCLRRAAAADPLREGTQRGLMEALAAGGNYAAAMEAYRDLRLRLHQELNAEPDPETRRLYEQIRAEARQKAAPSLRTSVPTEAEGCSRARRPGTAFGETQPPPHNLPLQLSSFVGREPQIAELKQWLAGPSRLVTLTGAGGCGKTRLALQVAAGLLEEYADGVWLVELASLADATLVPQAVAAALGVREEPGCPITQTLVSSLKPRGLLLVLDNCEHLVTACAELTTALLQACPRLRILATSREVLGVTGEIPYRVPSLSLPEADHAHSLARLTRSKAVRLFVERAVTAPAGFTLTNENAPWVAQICRQLDGLPLAIELAAARARALPVEQIASRLDDRFRLLKGSRTALPRHQTLKALIDWSYDLLSEPERLLLRRLSVFAGGWTLEAAGAVCAGSRIEALEVPELLTQLVDKSLVVYENREGEDRYRLLETIRQYARDRLLESEEVTSVRGRHLDWVTALAEQAGAGLFGREQVEWMRRLEREHDNLRAALSWSQESGAAEAGLRICASVWRFWLNRGYLVEWRAWVKSVLSRPEAAARTRARAKALAAAAVLALNWMGRDTAAARARYEEMLAIARELGDKQLLAAAHNGLGQVASLRGDTEQARLYFEQGLARAREVGDRWEVAFSLAALGSSQQENPDAAWPLHREALAIRRELGDHKAVAFSLNNMASLAKRQGDYKRARSLCAEALAIARDLGSTDIHWLLFTSGDLARVQGDYAVARSYFEEMRAIAPEPKHHIEWTVGDAIQGLGEVARDEGDLETARSLLEGLLHMWREVRFLPTWRALQSLGDVMRHQGDYTTADSLYEEALTPLQLGWERPGKPTKRATAGSLVRRALVAQKQGNGERATALCQDGLALYREAGDFGRKPETAECFEALGSLACAQGQFQHAARLLAAASALREAIGAPLPPVDRPEYERSVAAARAALGEERFAAAWAEGQAMPLEQAICAAFEEHEVKTSCLKSS